MITLCNNDFSTPQNYTVRDIVEGMGYDVGLKDYPVFDEAYRAHLNEGILAHFWFRRIASETPAKYVFYLNRYLNENMETYNAIYRKIKEQGFDPMATSQSRVIGDSQTGATADDKSGSGSDAKAVVSRTPQVYLEHAGEEKYMDSMTHNYADASNWANSKSSSQSGFSNFATSTDGGYSLVGLQLVQSRLLATDALVYDMLEPLHMALTDDLPR